MFKFIINNKLLWISIVIVISDRRNLIYTIKFMVLNVNNIVLIILCPNGTWTATLPYNNMKVIKQYWVE